MTPNLPDEIDRLAKEASALEPDAKVRYDNYTGPGDDGYCEWWEANGVRFDSEADAAQYLHFKHHAAEIAARLRREERLEKAEGERRHSEYRYEEQVRDKVRILNEYRDHTDTLKAKLQSAEQSLAAAVGERDEYRQWVNRVRSAIRCPECQCQSITLVDDNATWNCDSCKHRWPIAQPQAVPTMTPDKAALAKEVVKNFFSNHKQERTMSEVEAETLAIIERCSADRGKGDDGLCQICLQPKDSAAHTWHHKFTTIAADERGHAALAEQLNASQRDNSAKIARKTLI